MDLALSGSLFSVSGFVAYRYDNYITAYTSCLLSVTSILFHLHRTPLAIGWIKLHYILLFYDPLWMDMKKVFQESLFHLLCVLITI